MLWRRHTQIQKKEQTKSVIHPYIYIIEYTYIHNIKLAFDHITQVHTITLYKKWQTH